MKGRVRLMSGMLVGLALAGVPAAPAWAQSRVVVPIVIQAPRPTVPTATGTSSVAVRTQTLSPRPGVTTTLVTVTNTTGRALGVVPPVGASTRAPGPAPGIGPTPRLGPNLGSAAMALPPGVVRSRVTLEDTAVGTPGVVGRAPTTLTVTRWHTGLGQEKVSITSEAPIDAPIVILDP
jgi:hypothetical protein